MTTVINWQPPAQKPAEHQARDIEMRDTCKHEPHLETYDPAERTWRATCQHCGVALSLPLT